MEEHSTCICAMITCTAASPPLMPGEGEVGGESAGGEAMLLRGGGAGGAGGGAGGVEGGEGGGEGGEGEGPGGLGGEGGGSIVQYFHAVPLFHVEETASAQA